MECGEFGGPSRNAMISRTENLLLVEKDLQSDFKLEMGVKDVWPSPAQGVGQPITRTYLGLLLKIESIDLL